MSIRRKLVRAILWEPITWVPLTLATGVVTFLSLRWWANVLTFATAFGFVGAVWGRMLPRLLALWETEDAQEKLQAEEDQHRAFLAELRAQKLAEAAEQLEAADAFRRQILGLIKANPWLESFDYARNTLRLIADMEQTARTMLVPAQDRRADHWKAKKESLGACLAALQDTLQTVEQTVKETAAAGEIGPDSGVAAQVIKKNRITRQVLKDMNDPEPPQTQ